MLSLSIDGAEALQARLDAFPAAVLSELAAKAQALGEALADKVRNEKLSGQVSERALGRATRLDRRRGFERRR